MTERTVAHRSQRRCERKGGSVRTSPVMTFKCPACGITADVWVPLGGRPAEIRMTIVAGLVVGGDFENPRQTIVFHGCTQDTLGVNTQMIKIGEHD